MGSDFGGSANGSVKKSKGSESVGGRGGWDGSGSGGEPCGEL